MKVLAIDPGTRCGWAWYDDDAGLLECGTERFELRRGESAGMRFLAFRRWLEVMLSVGTGLVPRAAQLVVFEHAMGLRSGAAIDLIVGMTSRIEEVAAVQGIDYKGVNSSTLKKAVTGKGNCDKTAMEAPVRARFGSAVPAHADDNLIDALGLLMWYQDGMIEPAPKQVRRAGAAPVSDRAGR